MIRAAILALVLCVSCASPAENRVFDYREATLLQRQAAGQNVDAELDDLDKDRLRANYGVIVDVIDSFVPVPLQPWKTEILAAIALLARKRSRKHIVKAIKQPLQAGRHLLRATGLSHSSDDPMEVMMGAAKAAEAAGNDELAEQILQQTHDLATAADEEA